MHLSSYSKNTLSPERVTLVGIIQGSIYIYESVLKSVLIPTPIMQIINSIVTTKCTYHAIQTQYTDK